MPLAFDGVGFAYPADGAASDGAPTSGASGFALHDISFTVEPDEVVGLAGATGSGKSTVIRLANGLEAPDTGNVSVDGLSTANRKDRRRCLSMVGVAFQNPERQLFAQTVYDDIAYGPKNLGLGADEIETSVRDACAAVGLDLAAVRDENPFALSGGLQRRAAIAGVLALEPRYLVLDEPASGLDPAGRRALLGMIDGLARARSIGVVVASHDFEDLARICSRVNVLDQGEIALTGTPEDVFSHVDDLQRIGLEAPFATTFAHNLDKKKALDLRNSYYEIESLADEIAARYRARTTR